jgi:hypothetical protein
MTGDTYLDPGDRMSGRRDPAEPVQVLKSWCKANRRIRRTEQANQDPR